MIADSANLYHPPSDLQVPEAATKSRRRTRKKATENVSRPAGVSSSDSSSSLSDSDSEKKDHSLPVDGFNGDGTNDSIGENTSGTATRRGARPDATDKLETLREELVESGIYSKPPNQSPPPAPAPAAPPAVPPPPPPRRSLQSAQSQESSKSSGSPAASSSEPTRGRLERSESGSTETPTRLGSGSSRPPRPPPPRADSIARAREASISSPSGMSLMADQTGSGSGNANSSKNVFTFSEEETGRSGSVSGTSAGAGVGGLSSRMASKIGSKLPTQITQQLSSLQNQIGEIASRPEAQQLQQHTRQIVSQVTDVAVQIRDVGQANLNDLIAGAQQSLHTRYSPYNCTLHIRILHISICFFSAYTLHFR